MKIQIKDIAVKAAGVSAGAVAAKFANRFLGTLNPKIRALGKIAIGAIVPEFVPKIKIAGHIGTGFMAVGAAELFEEFVPSPTVSGAHDDIMNGALGGPLVIDEDFENEGVHGDDDDVSGTDDVVSGDDDEVAGDDDDY